MKSKSKRKIEELEKLLRVARADAENQRKLAQSRGRTLGEIRKVLGPHMSVTSYGAGGGGGGISTTPTVTEYQ